MYTSVFELPDNEASKLFLAGSCFQGTLGLANPLQPFSASLQFGGQFVSNVAAKTRFLFGADALRFLQQAANPLFQPLLLLFSCADSSSPCAAGIRLQLAAVDGDPPQLSAPTPAPSVTPVLTAPFSEER